jgi:hypothetical protein
MTNAKEAKERVKTLLRDMPDIRGVGLTWKGGHQCVLVNVAVGADQAVRERIKTGLPDVEFVIQEVGPITTT